MPEDLTYNHYGWEDNEENFYTNNIDGWLLEKDIDWLMSILSSKS